MVGPLSRKYVKPMLIRSTILEKTNAINVLHAINEAANLLYPGDENKYDKLWLILSDQAAYMIKLIKSLKPLYTKMNHVTCLAHAINRVCDKIQSQNQELNSFISKMKKILRKSGYRKILFK